MIAIIILNWNGLKDTISCLRSLKNIEGNFFVLVVDNGSTDNSVSEIAKWGRDISWNVLSLNEGEKIPDNLSIIHFKMICLSLKTNYGFAKGNNIALRIASHFNPSHYLFLNNDTEVSPDFLIILESFASSNPEYKILTPLICLYSNKDIIWNAGGKQLFGFRKYYYANNHVSNLPDKEFIPITFITGCALFVSSDIIKSSIFTERFFFGEEDFDFSWRMKDAGKKMCCVLASKIFHKVGASSAHLSSIGKCKVHYLNRSIDVRQHCSAFMFALWKFVNNIPMFHSFIKRGVSVIDAVVFVRDIYKQSLLYEEVSKDLYESFINGSR